MKSNKCKRLLGPVPGVDCSALRSFRKSFLLHDQPSKIIFVTFFSLLHKIFSSASSKTVVSSVKSVCTCALVEELGKKRTNEMGLCAECAHNFHLIQQIPSVDHGRKSRKCYFDYCPVIWHFCNISDIRENDKSTVSGLKVCIVACVTRASCAGRCVRVDEVSGAFV